jgi:hypothetical protein
MWNSRDPEIAMDARLQGTTEGAGQALPPALLAEAVPITSEAVAILSAQGALVAYLAGNQFLHPLQVPLLPSQIFPPVLQAPLGQHTWHLEKLEHLNWLHGFLFQYLLITFPLSGLNSYYKKGSFYRRSSGAIR